MVTNLSMVSRKTITLTCLVERDLDKCVFNQVSY